ncbi:MAG: PadR family transcriptional regulator [Marinicaulis sp.]|nr:PadR family transcriptional regulator [Marinicaulis sp.]
MTSGNMRLTTADLVVLTVLSFERPMHGYELVKLLEERDVKDWAPISRPQVYYSIRKLAEGGFILPAKVHAPALGPERMVYKPARKAKPALEKALGEPKWVEQRTVTPFTSWAALALMAGRQTVDRQIKRRKNFLKAEIKREKETLKSLDGVEARDVGVARVLVSVEIKKFEAELLALGDLKMALMR